MIFWSVLPLDHRHYTNLIKASKYLTDYIDLTLFTVTSTAILMTNRRIRSIDHSNQAKLPSIIRKSTTSYSPVDTADKDITLHFPTFQRCETNHSRLNKAPPSFPAGKKSNQYFCLAFDNELPPVLQIDKTVEYHLRKLAETKKKSIDKLNKQMPESSSTCDPFTSATCQSWPNVPTKQ